MAVIKRISSKATPKKIVNYLTQKEKTEESLISGKDCTPSNVLHEFSATKEFYNKTDGVQYHHIVQSFKPGEVTAEKAHELGKELAESQFKGYEVFIVTHKDKEHIHNHLVVNSVSFENGKKYEASNKSLWDIKRESNRLCEREDLQTLDLNHKAKERLTSAELRIELRGGISWKEELKQCIDYAKAKSNSFEDFQKNLKDNFNIDTRITNKTISYQHPDKAKPIRGSKLGAAYDKEELLNGFTRKEKSVVRERDQAGAKGNTRGEVPRSTSNVDWTAVRDNVQSKGNRVSEQPGNDVVREIQRKVRSVKERTDRTIGNNISENKELRGQQPIVKAEHEPAAAERQQDNRPIREPAVRKVPSRGWER